jgi:alkylmercury lyase
MDTMSPKVMPQAMIPLAVDIMKRLATGNRVTRGEVARLAGDLGDPEIIVDTLAKMGMADLDADGAIVGMIVTINPTRHRLEIGSHTTYTWCAVDTLFMPAVLGQSAVVHSTCPETGDAIRLEVHPDGLGEVTPSDTYVSFVAPGITEGVTPSCGGGVDGLTGTDGAFCANANFFASSAAAERWRATHAGSIVLPAIKGFELARRIWTQPFRT